MEKRTEWSGYPEQLYHAIRQHSAGLEERLIGSSSHLMRANGLPRAVPALMKVCGIEVEMNKRLQPDDNRNGIVIRRVGRGTQPEPTPNGPGEDGSPQPPKDPPKLGTPAYPRLIIRRINQIRSDGKSNATCNRT
jgi:hypothetical protein